MGKGGKISFSKMGDTNQNREVRESHAVHGEDEVTNMPNMGVKNIAGGVQRQEWGKSVEHKSKGSPETIRAGVALKKEVTMQEGGAPMKDNSTPALSG